ncbi:uncharacterized protein LOC141643412 [Silene latifolia]|uniref:uncharacterized protein LOC141643412 n=1 Tax=Silene latifolia TaxID=37657 RepID=UPI003D7737C0
MSNEKGSGFVNWDKRETRYHDVAFNFRLQQQQQQHHPEYSPSGEGCAKTTFTANQRQELERQTVIYKYIMASMPVPPELIIPVSKYPSSSLRHTDQSSVRNAMELRYNALGRGGGSVGGNPEPWRCKRTDGKKWRCSRDVAPDQKYCDRHSHKTRPSARSRKPVESSLLVSSATTSRTSTSNPNFINPSSSHEMSSSLRYPQWFMKDEAITPTAQILYPNQIEQFSHTSRFSPTMSLSDHTTDPLQRPFIDAWSLEDASTNLNKYPNTSSSVDTILPLTLSMSARFEPNSQNNAKDDNHCVRETRTSQQQPLNWMSSWANLPSGGPLAEALCLGMPGPTDAWATHSEELVSPHGHSNSSHASGGTTNCQGFHLE